MTQSGDVHRRKHRRGFMEKRLARREKAESYGLMEFVFWRLE